MISNVVEKKYLHPVTFSKEKSRLLFFFPARSVYYSGLILDMLSNVEDKRYLHPVFFSKRKVSPVAFFRLVSYIIPV
jgi:hypothetical protein